MECSLAQKKMRPFSKLIGCFSRIAEELGIEANQDGLTLRAVSLAQSGFVGAHLPSRFFDNWQLEKRVPRCKVTLKPLHAILKSVNNVERCNLKIDEAESKLVFEFHCRLGVKKVFKLVYDDTSETMQAIFAKDSCPNFLSLKTRILAEATQNIAAGIEEVSLLASSNRVKLRTHVGPETVLNKTLLSEVILVDKDFDSYRIVDGSQELIFPMKELKAVIGLADALSLPVSMYFKQEAGTPIIFSLDGSQLLHLSVDVVLATQVDSATLTSPCGTPSKAATSSSPAPSPHPSPAPSASSSQQAGHSRSAGLSGLSPVHTIPGIPKRGAAQSDSDVRSGPDSDSSPTKRARTTPSPPQAAPAKPAAAAGGGGGGGGDAGAPVQAPPKRVLWIPNVDDDEDALMAD